VDHRQCSPPHRECRSSAYCQVHDIVVKRRELPCRT
jgi:hypothetical protein